MAAHHVGDGLQLLPRQRRPARILGRVDNQQAGALVDQFGQPAQVGMVSLLLQQLHRHRLRAAELDHRLVDGKARVGIDHFRARLRQGQQHVEHDGLGPRRNHHLLPVRVDSPNLAAVARHRLPQFRQARRGAVVGVPVPQRLHPGLHDVLRRFKVRLSDLQVDNLPSLGFKGARFGQHLKGGFGTQAAHSSGNSHGFGNPQNINLARLRPHPKVTTFSPLRTPIRNPQGQLIPPFPPFTGGRRGRYW